MIHTTAPGAAQRRVLAVALLLLAPLAEVVTVDFSTLSDFDYEEGMELPKKVQKFDGKKVRSTGFIRTDDGATEDLEEFWIVNQNCDCQGAPLLNEVVWYTLPDGTTVTNDDAPITVEGTLHVKEEKADDYVLYIYRLEADAVD